MSATLFPTKNNNKDRTGNTGTARRFWISLNSERAQRCAIMLVPIAFGLISLLLGPDSNWDLRNYHLYNAYAFLNNKLSIDLAPAGMQSYFNPLLDIPYYLAINHWPPRLVGFLMGAMHGLNFVLVLAICRRLLSGLPQQDAVRTPLLLALAGCLTANFLSELGNTMGDNTTALFCLAAVWIALHAVSRIVDRQAGGDPLLLSAGLLAGLATGLKLTNAPHAAAICLALLALPISPARRVKAGFVFGMGVLAGMAITGGFWFYTMWQTFGNPLFPQFGRLFPNPLASAVGVADTSWLPKGWWQYLAWPFLISLDAQKVGQLPVRQIIWAIVYALLLLLPIRRFLLRHTRPETGAMQAESRFLLTAVVLGFVLWMALFSVSRYLIALELLAPLIVFLLCARLLPYATARVVAFWTIGFATLIVLLGGVRTWGHEGWSDAAFHVDVPTLSEPARSTVLITQDDPPWGWLAVAFPPTVAFAQLNVNFPRGPAFAAKVGQIVESRGGPVYALFQGEHDGYPERAARMRQMADRLGLTASPGRCAALRWMVDKFRLRASIVTDDAALKPGSCRLDMQRREPAPDLDAQNRVHREKALQVLRSYGYSMREQACTLHAAGIGDGRQTFQWCPVEPGLR